MTYVVKQSGTHFEQIKPDSYPAKLVQIIGVGTTEREDKFHPNADGSLPMVDFTGVVLGFAISASDEVQYTPVKFPKKLSLHEKANLRAFISPFFPSVTEMTDLDSLVGKDCLLSFVPNKKKPEYTNIDKASMLPSIIPPISTTAEQFTYFPDRDGFAGGSWAKLPAFIQDKVRESKEYKASKEDKFGDNEDSPAAPAAGELIKTEDIPF